jgi:hypothetical protein
MLRAMLLAPIFAATAMTAQTVDGHVVSAATGFGVSGVRVALLQGSSAAYTAVTDSEGRFSISTVKDGSYVAMYRARGFFAFPGVIDAPNQSRFLVVTGGDPIHLEAKLRPVPKVSGRVLDAAAKPVPNAAVFVLQRQRGPCDTRACLATLQKMETGEKGEYKTDNLQALPGDWMISATAPTNWPPPEPRDGQRFGWATTLYPGVTDPQSAEKIPGTAAGDLWVPDIKLAAVPVRRVRGKVLSLHGDPVKNAQLTLGNGAGPALHETSKDDGTFEFASVPDGEWRFSAHANQDTAKLWAAEWLNVKRADLEDVELRLAAPFTLRAEVVSVVPEGMPAPKLADSLDLELSYEGNDQMEDAPHVTHHSTGKGVIEIQNVYPGNYRALILNSPAGQYYLDSIRLGDLDALASSVPVQSDAQTLVITYRFGGGTIRGTVEDCGPGEVILLPIDPALRRGETVRDAACGPNGQFGIDAVRPGEYYAIAVAADGTYRPLNALQDEDILIRRAARITVRANEHSTIDLRLMALQ